MTLERPAATLPQLSEQPPCPLPMKSGASVSTSSGEWFVGPTDRASGSLGREPKIADAL
jgi:hypothetical protein